MAVDLELRPEHRAGAEDAYTDSRLANLPFHVFEASLKRRGLCICPIDAVAALREQNSRLREALEEIASDYWPRNGYSQAGVPVAPLCSAEEAQKLARKALQKEGE